MGFITSNLNDVVLNNTNSRSNASKSEQERILSYQIWEILDGDSKQKIDCSNLCYFLLCSMSLYSKNLGK